METNFYKKLTIVLFVIVIVLGVLIAHINKENGDKAKPKQQEEQNYKLICN